MRFTIPNDWRLEKLSCVAEVQTGIAKGKKDIEHPVDLPYLRVANVQDGYLDLTEIKTITVAARDIERFRLKSGDVLFTEGGDADKLGRGTVWANEVDVCLHQNHVFAVRVDENRLIPRFLAVYASSFYGKSYFLSCSKQSTNLASINSKQLKNMPLPLPSVSEQRAIVDRIEIWDRAIGLNVKLLGAKRKYSAVLAQQLLTGKVRIQTTIGRKKRNPSHIVRVPSAVRRGIYPPSVQPGIPKLIEKPDGWDMKTMGELLKTKKRCVRLDGDTEYDLVVAKRNRGGIEPRGKLRGDEIRTTAQFKVKAGDFVISRRQIIHGACGIVPESLDGAIVSNEYSVFTVNEHLDPGYLRLLSHSLYFQQTCFHSSVGVAVEKMIFKVEKWLKYPFLVPPIDEQRAIANTLETAEAEITLLQKRVNLLKRQKKGLMQQLLTGKTRVKLPKGTA